MMSTGTRSAHFAADEAPTAHFAADDRFTAGTPTMTRFAIVGYLREVAKDVVCTCGTCGCTFRGLVDFPHVSWCGAVPRCPRHVKPGRSRRLLHFRLTEDWTDCFTVVRPREQGRGGCGSGARLRTNYASTKRYLSAIAGVDA